MSPYPNNLPDPAYPGITHTAANRQAGDRLVAFTDTGVCDGRYEHDIRLWTDGIVAYAECDGPEGREECNVSRDLTTIEVSCGATVDHSQGGNPIYCTGVATFDLQDEAWTADAEALRYLNSYAERIEQ